MTQSADLILVLIILSNFVILGTRELRVCIRTAAVQGALLSVLPLLVHREPGWRAILMVVGAALVKGIVVPTFLFKAIRHVKIRQEVNPYVGFIPSLFLCAVGSALALLFAGSLPLAPEHAGSLLVPTSLATILSGFLILTTRRKAISQVVGYLMLENGIFIFGLLLIEAMPFLVEAGVLLDLFAGIFIMGIVLNHIQSEFSSLDTHLLSDLKD
jgi:hydrogenase-4 component E